MIVRARLRAIHIILILGTLAGMAISYRAWVSTGTFGREFPNISIMASLRAVPHPWDVVHAAAVVPLLLATIWRRESRGLKLAAVVATASLVIFDQVRFQPWLYEYMLMLTVLAMRRRGSEADDTRALGSLQIIIACIYIFSGLHKVNYSFFHESVTLLLKPLRQVLPAQVPINWLGWFMPALEAAL